MEQDGESFGDGDEDELERSLASRQVESPEVAADTSRKVESESSGSEYEVEEDDQHPRFQGFDTTYRSHIRNEVALLDSLSRQDSANLGVHLYNAHSWKRRYYETNARHLTSAQSKTSWLQPDGTGVTPWHPSPDWTAWPLPPEILKLDNGSSFGSLHKTSSKPTPVQDLREEIQGLMLRRAKEQFQLRTWSQHDSMTPEVVDPPRNPELEEDEDSGGLASIDSPATESRSASILVEELPSFVDDDEDAGNLLRPMVQHIASNFDDLLYGLHKNRKGHRLREAYSRPSSSRSASQSAPDQLSTSSNIPSKPRHSTQPGLRDWSEVLGVASLVGWDPSIIEAAHQRCRDMFNEDMSFRKLPEPLSQVSESLYNYKLEKIPHSAHASEEDDHLDVDMKDVGEARAKPNNQHFCPYPTCGRSDVPYEKAWRWRAHLKRKHKITDEQVRELEERVSRQDEDEGGSVNDDEGFICPHEDCSRHVQPYAARWRLHEHLKRTHGFTLEDAKKLVDRTFN